MPTTLTEFTYRKLHNARRIEADVSAIFPDPLQTNIVFAFLAGHTPDQVALTLHVAPSLVEQTLAQARRRLEPGWQFRLESLQAIYGDIID
jgi:DNA-directed RNA polymerase specialized sigma24 family protein